jgi:hypothetical protein
MTLPMESGPTAVLTGLHGAHTLVALYAKLLGYQFANEAQKGVAEYSVVAIDDLLASPDHPEGVTRILGHMAQHRAALEMSRPSVLPSLIGGVRGMSLAA